MFVTDSVQKGGVFIIGKLISSLELLIFAGEGSGYSSRVYLIYDGIHYDPLAVQSSDTAVPLQTVFPVDDDMRLAEALEIAADAKQVRLIGSTVAHPSAPGFNYLLTNSE